MVVLHFVLHRVRFASNPRKLQMPLEWFDEILSSHNNVLKRDSGFPSQDAAQIAGGEDQRK
jgi:hypothetical protein